MTRTELRTLYLLAKHGGQAKHWQLSQAMARIKRKERERALANLEELELVSSVKTPAPKGKGGTGGLVYWLTDTGRQTVADLTERGELRDPARETRGRPAL